MTNEELAKRLSSAKGATQSALQLLLVEVFTYKSMLIKTNAERELLNAYYKEAHEQISLMSFGLHFANLEMIESLIVNIRNLVVK